MVNLNKIFLYGNITKNLELSSNKNGRNYCFFTIASNYSVRDPDKEDKYIDKTDFIPMTAWGKDAENLVKYMKKGSAIFVEGKIKHDSKKDESGNWTNKMFIQINRIQYLPSGQSNRQQADPDAEFQDYELSDAELDGSNIQDVNMEDIPF